MSFNLMKWKRFIKQNDTSTNRRQPVVSVATSMATSMDSNVVQRSIGSFCGEKFYE